MDILVNRERVDWPAVIVHRSEAERRGHYRFSRYFSPLRLTRL
jgi:hypothetical protein